jgi:hypothetical protein
VLRPTLSRSGGGGLYRGGIEGHFFTDYWTTVGQNTAPLNNIQYYQVSIGIHRRMFPPCNSGIRHFLLAFERRAGDVHGANPAFKMSRGKLGGGARALEG